MYIDILKQLFIELFNVNHLMLDLIDKVEDTDWGDESLVGFYAENIKEEYNEEELLKYKDENSYSCLNNLDEEEIEEFLNDIFN